MRRWLSVWFVPSAIFVGCVWVMARTGALAGGARWSAVVPGDAGEVLGTLVVIGVGAAVLGLLVQPFQIGAVRVLEGYWDRWPPAARVAAVLVEYQRRRWQALNDACLDHDEHHSRPGLDEERPYAVKPLPDEVREQRRRAEVRRKRAAAARRLAVLPPRAEVLMPTALGNALRAGEITAGERYGLATLTSWPRIYPQISAPLMAAVESARDTLDGSVNLCHSLVACTLVMGVAFVDEPANWWFPAASLVAAVVAYQGAAAAGRTYSGLMRVVYDLHRFDLVRALHHPLPNRDTEWSLFQRISDALAGGAPSLPYDHGQSGSGSGSGPGEADRAAQPEDV